MGSESIVAFQQNMRNEVRYINGDDQIVGALSAEHGMHQQNYVSIQDGRAINKQQNGRGWNDDGAAYTLDGTGSQAVAGYGVRRLTPTECERLQGFPDGWTGGFADSVRYKMLGNAVAVPCAEWIGRRIVEIESGKA